ncbi:hypothetical protein DM860_007519 [Cuscuta australis]|nr:hypothetical protein DM860_007519 [Cuscuta australis]
MTSYNETSASHSADIAGIYASAAALEAGPAVPPPPVFFPVSSSAAVADDLHRLVNYQHTPPQFPQNYFQNLSPHHFPPPPSLPPLPAPQSIDTLAAAGTLHPATSAFCDRLWDWSSMVDASRDFTS